MAQVLPATRRMRTICADLAPGGIHGGWGRSAFDHRHYLSMIYVWAIPVVHSGNAGWNGFLSAGTNHWTVSGTSQFQIGPASSAGISNIDTNGDGQFNDRPHLGSASASIFTLGEDGTYVSATTCGTVKTTYTPGVLYDNNRRRWQDAISAELFTLRDEARRRPALELDAALG